MSSGSRGTTLSEILEGMSFPSQESLKLGCRDITLTLKANDDFTLVSANTIFVQSGSFILPTYKKVLRDYYHTVIQSADFMNAREAAR